MFTWPDVALALGLIAAIVALHVFTPDDPSSRSTILILVGVLGPWLASVRQQRQVQEVKEQVQQLQDDIRQ
jgi:hypothetical protein